MSSILEDVAEEEDLIVISQTRPGYKNQRKINFCIRQSNPRSKDNEIRRKR